MANSGQNKQVDGSFDDDLDKMLQDTADQIDDDQEVLDSDDAIDRLLGDSQYVETLDEGFSESVDDLVDSLLDGVVTEQGRKAGLSDEEVDEFADDPVEVEVPDNAVEPESESVFADDEMSAFADDLLSEQKGIDAAMQEKPKADVDSTESMDEIDEFSSDDEEDDFLLADFDISADDDDFKDELSTPEQVAPVEQVVVAEPAAPSEEVAAAAPAAVTTPAPEVRAGVVGGGAQSEKKSQIINEPARLKPEADFSEALDKAVKELKRANRELDETSKKLKIWSISALVIGVIALIVGVTVVVLNLGVQSSVERVQGSVMDIEDRLAVPVIKLVDPNDEKIEDLQLGMQSMQGLVKDMPERLNALQGQVNSINTEEIQKVVDKQLIDINEKLAVLELKLAGVKSAKIARAITPRKAVKSVAVQEWVVNLVSFKQRWYTDKKVLEYKQKGIPAEVTSIDVQGVEWFRVRVIGFKNKAEAAVYAIKMKKSLNLNSVWVSKK